MGLKILLEIVKYDAGNDLYDQPTKRLVTFVNDRRITLRPISATRMK